MSSWAEKPPMPAMWQSGLHPREPVHNPQQVHHAVSWSSSLLSRIQLNWAGKRQCTQKMSTRSTNNRCYYFTVSVKWIKCLGVGRVFLRVLFSQHLCFGAANIDLETGWFPELLLICSSQRQLRFIAEHQTIFTQVRKDVISWLALGSPTWKDLLLLLAFMPLYCILCTLLFSHLFSYQTTKQPACILACLQTNSFYE